MGFSTPTFIFHLRRLMALRRHERPVLFVLRARGDPLFERVDLLRRERLALGRHPLGFVGGGDASDECAVGHVTGHDRVQAGIKLGDSAFRPVEPQTAFVLGRSVAGEATASEEWLDVVGEADGGIGPPASAVPSAATASMLPSAIASRQPIAVSTGVEACGRDPLISSAKCNRRGRFRHPLCPANMTGYIADPFWVGANAL